MDARHQGEQPVEATSLIRRNILSAEMDLGGQATPEQKLLHERMHSGGAGAWVGLHGGGALRYYRHRYRAIAAIPHGPWFTA